MWGLTLYIQNAWDYLLFQNIPQSARERKLNQKANSLKICGMLGNWFDGSEFDEN